MSISCEIELERRRFKTPTFIAAEGLQKDLTTITNANYRPTPPSRRPFKSLEFMADGPGISPGAFAIQIQQYIFVYEVDGTLRWTVAIDRHTEGDFNHAQGLCFGLEQDVYAGWIDFVPGNTQGYIFHFDKNGNFLSERPAVLFNDSFKRSLVCSPRGLILLSRQEFSTMMGESLSNGAEYHLTGLSTSGNSALTFDDEDNVYCRAHTNATGAAFWKWDSEGNLLDVVPSSYAIGLMAVAGDGSYAWTVYLVSTSGGQLQYQFNKVNLQTGLLIAQATRFLDDFITSVRLAPWGELLWELSDVDASQIGEHQLVARGLMKDPANPDDFLSGMFIYDGLEVWRGTAGATLVHSVATAVK